jgi:hypothetical protein
MSRIPVVLIGHIVSNCNVFVIHHSITTGPVTINLNSSVVASTNKKASEKG